MDNVVAEGDDVLRLERGDQGCDVVDDTAHRPLIDFEIVVAMVLSYFVFKFVPTSEAVVGLIIIISSGLFVSWRAMKNNRTISKQSESVIEML